MILMSGCATPVEEIKGMPAGEVWNHAWPLIVISCVTLPLASVFIRSRLQ